MKRVMYKSKIHRATLTDADLNYEGSATVDSDLLDAADILPYEKVQIVNINNGSRLETYVIEGERGSGEICLNGAAARLGEPGDVVIIISYAEVEDAEAREWKPKTILVDEQNRIKNGESKPAAERFPHSANLKVLSCSRNGNGRSHSIDRWDAMSL